MINLIKTKLETKLISDELRVKFIKLGLLDLSDIKFDHLYLFLDGNTFHKDRGNLHEENDISYSKKYDISDFTEVSVVDFFESYKKFIELKHNKHVELKLIEKPLFETVYIKPRNPLLLEILKWDSKDNQYTLNYEWFNQEYPGDYKDKELYEDLEKEVLDINRLFDCWVLRAELNNC